MKRIIAAVLCFILFFTVIFASVYIKRTLGAGKTVTAVVKDFEKSAETEAYVVKNETEIDLSGGSFSRFYYKNGERVSGGAKVISIYNSESDGALISEIEKLDERIKQLGSDYVNLTANDVIKVENYIDADIDKLQDVMLSGDAAEQTLLKDRLTALFNIKHTNEAPANDDKDALNAEKALLEAKLSTAKNDITAPVGGIFCDKTDGYEGLVSEEKAKSMTVSEFDEMMKAEPGENKNACKIIDNYKWYVVCKVKSSVVNEKKTGDVVSMITEDGEKLKAIIEYISDEEGAYRVVTLSSDRDYALLQDARKIKVKIIFDSFTGFVLPSKAFHAYEGEYGVFVKKNSKKIFKATDVLYSDDEYTVVGKSDKTELKLYDTVITDGDFSEYYD